MGHIFLFLLMPHNFLLETRNFEYCNGTTLGTRFILSPGFVVAACCSSSCLFSEGLFWPNFVQPILFVVTTDVPNSLALWSAGDLIEISLNIQNRKVISWSVQLGSGFVLGRAFKTEHRRLQLCLQARSAGTEAEASQRRELRAYCTPTATKKPYRMLQRDWSLSLMLRKSSPTWST